MVYTQPTILFHFVLWGLHFRIYIYIYSYWYVCSLWLDLSPDQKIRKDMFCFRGNYVSWQRIFENFLNLACQEHEFRGAQAHEDYLDRTSSAVTSCRLSNVEVFVGGLATHMLELPVFPAGKSSTLCFFQCYVTSQWEKRNVSCQHMSIDYVPCPHVEYGEVFVCGRFCVADVSCPHTLSH